MTSPSSSDRFPLLSLPDAVLLRILAHLCAQPPSPSLRLHLPLKQQAAYMLSQCSRHLDHLFHQQILQTIDVRPSSLPVFQLGTFVTQNMIPSSTTFTALRRPDHLKRLIQMAGPSLRTLFLPDFRETNTPMDDILQCVEKHATNLENLTFIQDNRSIEGDDDDSCRMSYLPQIISRVKDLVVYDPDKVIIAALATRSRAGLRRLAMHDVHLESSEIFMHILLHDVSLPPPRLDSIEVSFTTPIRNLDFHVTILAEAIQYHADLRDVTVLERTNVLVSHPSHSFPTKSHLQSRFQDLLEMVNKLKSGDGIIMSNKPAIARNLSDENPPPERLEPLDRLALFSSHFDTYNNDISLIEMLQLFEDRIGPETLLELDFQEARLISPPKSSNSPEPYFSTVRISSHSGFLYELPENYFRNMNEICIGMNTLFKSEPSGHSQIYPPTYAYVRSVCRRAGHNVTIFRAGIGHRFKTDNLQHLHQSLETLSDVVGFCPNIQLLEISQNLIIVEDDDWVLLELLFEAMKKLQTLNLIDPRPFLEDLTIGLVFEHLPNVLDSITPKCPCLQVILMSRPIGHGVIGMPTKDSLDKVEVALRRFAKVRPEIDTSEIAHVTNYFQELLKSRNA